MFAVVAVVFTIIFAVVDTVFTILFAAVGVVAVVFPAVVVVVAATVVGAVFFSSSFALTWTLNLSHTRWSVTLHFISSF